MSNPASRLQAPAFHRKWRYENTAHVERSQHGARTHTNGDHSKSFRSRGLVAPLARMGPGLDRGRERPSGGLNCGRRATRRRVFFSEKGYYRDSCRVVRPDAFFWTSPGTENQIMKKFVFTGLTILLFVLCLPGRSSGQWFLDFENGLAVPGYNDVRIPGDTGTLFSLSEELNLDSSYFFRLRVGFQWKSRHGLSLLAAIPKHSGSATASTSGKSSTSNRTGGFSLSAR